MNQRGLENPIIPITVVSLGAEEEALVLEVLRSGHLAQGPMVEQLESACREMAGTRHAVAVNNGTTALVLTIEALDLSPGDEVITSPFTFVATLNAILEAGATARFADIGDDFNIDPEVVSSLIGPRTKVLLPVHLYGLPADMGPLSAIAASNGLHLVEDAAQAHGAEVDGRRVGSFGHGCFSFYATKNITAGEGGVITTDDDELADRMRVLRNQGMRLRYHYERPGHNYRLTDIAAAVALPQFARMHALTETRRRNAAYLSERLAAIPGLVPPVDYHGRRSVWHQYTVRITSEAKLCRDEFLREVTARGVGCGVYYPRAVYDYPCYRAHPRVIVDGSPRAESVASSVASLPVHPHLTQQDLERIVSTTREVLGC